MTAPPSSFADAARAYRTRVAYPPWLFTTLAERFLPAHPRRLADLAAGTGRLAAGFSPYFEECLLIDSSPEMLAEARHQAYAETCRVSFLCTRVEDLTADLGPCDAVSIGRALHLLPRQPTLDSLERITAPGSLILLCEAGTRWDKLNAWFGPCRAVGGKYKNPGPRVADSKPYAFFAGSPFEHLDSMAVAGEQQIALDDLVERTFSYSTSNRAVLGDRAPSMADELRDTLQPFAVAGVITEAVFCQAVVFRRR